jgi:hypothetical protein
MRIFAIALAVSVATAGLVVACSPSGQQDTRLAGGAIDKYGNTVYMPDDAPDDLNNVAVNSLYKETLSANDLCEAAGGGISGSPDCDKATALEERLESLHYCIDYPHNEKLAKCSELKRRG